MYLQLLIADNEMPSGANHQRRLHQPSPIFKPQAMPALNGTLPFGFIFLCKFIRYCMHDFEHLKNVDIIYIGYFNQLDPLDVKDTVGFQPPPPNLLSGCLLS